MAYLNNLIYETYLGDVSPSYFSTQNATKSLRLEICVPVPNNPHKIYFISHNTTNLQQQENKIWHKNLTHNAQICKLCCVRS